MTEVIVLEEGVKENSIDAEQEQVVEQETQGALVVPSATELNMAKLSNCQTTAEVAQAFQIPETPEGLKNAIGQLEIIKEAYIGQLKSKSLTNNLWEQRKNEAFFYAALLLYTKSYVGSLIRDAKAEHGRRKRTAKQALAQTFNLTKRECNTFPRLTDDKIKMAIEYAKELKRLPTLEMALSHKLNPNFHAPEESKPLCQGEYDPLNRTENIVFDEPIGLCALFASIEIDTYRLKDLNVHCRVANEIDPFKASWHRELYPDSQLVEGDFMDDAIFKEVVQAYKDQGCTTLLATPSCHPFTIQNTSPSRFSDPECAHILQIIKMIKEVLPENICIEEVPGFWNAGPQITLDIMQKALNGRTIGQYICDELKTLGYFVNCHVDDAKNFGACEQRKRLIITASKHSMWYMPVHNDRCTLPWEVISKFESLEPGQVSKKHRLHYDRGNLTPETYNALIHTPTGLSAKDNPKEFRPTLKDGTAVGGYFQSFQRLSWDKPFATITGSNGELQAFATVHPGYLRPDGTYTDARVLSIAEIFAVLGLDEDFLIPSSCVLDEKGMLNEKDERKIRMTLGQHFHPYHLRALFRTIPLK